MRSANLLLLLAACGSADPVTVGPTQVQVDEDDVVTFVLSGLDDRGRDDDLEVTVSRLPEHGTLTPEAGAAPLSVTYTPASDYHGADTLSYVVTDRAGRVSAVGRVVVVVGPVNDPPVARDATAETDSVTPVDIDVLANDTDVDGDVLVVAQVGEPAHGAAVSVGGGVVRYTPRHPHPGADSFTYTVSDGRGGTDQATVRVEVTEGEPVTIASFTAQPVFPITGDVVTLSWSTVRAENCTIDQGIDTGGAPIGFAWAVPLVATTWTLTCEGPGGPTSATVAALPWPTDADGDGLSDLGERMLGTDEHNPDTDGDGIPDGLEIRTNPLDPDSDDDGIPDGLEDLDRNGRVDPGELDPANPDSNGDGVCDGPRVDAESDGLDLGGDCTDPTVWYVAEGSFGDGTSWDSAYGWVQDAIDASQAGDHIWVRAGRYTALSAAIPVAALPSLRHLFGGFHGGETTLLERAPTLPTTILDGDFDGDGLDPSSSSTYLDNSHNVVRLEDTEVTLDGFTITGGRGAPTISESTRVNGGVQAIRSTARMSRVHLIGNHASRGAAAGGSGAVVHLADAVIEGNAGLGHAVQFVGSTVSIADSLLLENDIGAVSMTSDSRLDLRRVRVADNAWVGGAVLIRDTDARLFDVDFVGNVTTGTGNGSALQIAAEGVSRDIMAVDVSFVDNVGGFGAVTVDGLANIQLRLYLTHVDFVDNRASTAGAQTRAGGITHADATVVVRNAVFHGNEPLDVLNRRGTPTSVAFSASDRVLAGNTLLTAFPFVFAASGERFLDPVGEAIGLGDLDAAGDPDHGYPAFGTRYARRASTDALRADGATVDAGRRHSLLTPVIRALWVDADTVAWDVANVAECTLMEVEGGEPFAVLAWPTVGTLPHGLDAGAEIEMTCWRESATRARRATASVP